MCARFLSGERSDQLDNIVNVCYTDKSARDLGHVIDGASLMNPLRFGRIQHFVTQNRVPIMPPVTPQTSPLLSHVRELPAGDKIIGFYLIAKIEVKPTRTGGQYLEMRLQDASGTMHAKMWEGFEEFAATAKSGEAVKLEAVVDRYRDTPDLKVNRIRLATEEEVPDTTIFLPRSKITPEEAREQIEQLIGTVNNEHILRLLHSIFHDEEFVERFLISAAGKLWHHAMIGGLAEHTIGVTRAVECICQYYPLLNKDLCVAGGLLHDIGKIFELSSDTAIDYNAQGRLLGHVFMGADFVERKIKELPDFPDEIRMHVLHIILSHQGDLEYGSPVKPMTPEALAIHYFDELDSRLEAFQRVRNQTPEGQPFSDYVKLMERYFYLRSIDDETQTEDDRP
jgi:3'-5' exoribonuclease